MPATPLHMGAGLAIKALAGRHFSVLAFGVAQVAMDIEPLVGIISGADVLHGPTHTYLGAFVIAVVVTALTAYSNTRAHSSTGSTCTRSASG
jgi:biotin transporter BioY